MEVKLFYRLICLTLKICFWRFHYTTQVNFFEHFHHDNKIWDYVVVLGLRRDLWVTLGQWNSLAVHGVLCLPMEFPLMSAGFLYFTNLSPEGESHLTKIKVIGPTVFAGVMVTNRQTDRIVGNICGFQDRSWSLANTAPWNFLWKILAFSPIKRSHLNRLFSLRDTVYGFEWPEKTTQYETHPWEILTSNPKHHQLRFN